MIAEKLGLSALFENLRDMLLGKLQSVIDSVLILPSSIGEFILDMRDSLKEKIHEVVTAVTNLPDLIINGIKRIFVPDADIVNGKIDALKNEMYRLGVVSYDMSGIFNKEQPFEDITCTIMGSQVTIVNMAVVDKVVTHFRGVIRGFMWLMLVFYNFNQFMGLIGQKSMTLGGIIATARTKGDDV